METLDTRASAIDFPIQHGDPWTLTVLCADGVPSTLAVWVALRQTVATPLVELASTSVTGGRSYALAEVDSLALSPSKAYQLVAKDADTGVTWFTGPVKPSTEGAPGPTTQTVTLALAEATVTVELTATPGAGGGPGATALADLTDVDVTSDPPAQDDVLAWDDTESKWTPATLDGGVALSDATPQDLGTAAAGVSDEASRADHVHDMPTATDVGADPSGTAATAVTVHTADTTAVHGIADTSALVVTSDARLSDARTPTAHTHPAADIAVDASGFNGNLTTSDDTVQEIAQKLDDLTIPAAGIADPGGSNDDFLQRKSGAWTNRTVAQVKADLNLRFIPFVTGGYYSLGGGSTASNTVHNLNAAGRFTAMPVYLPAGSYSEIGVTVSSAAVSTWQFGVYANNPSTMRPDGQPLLASSGTVNMNAGTGFVGASISLTLSSSAVVWLAAHCVAYTASPWVNCYTGRADVQPVLPWIGARTIYNVPGRQEWGAVVNNVGTGAIPSLGPTTLGEDLLPRLIVRAA